jgi:hypothetical protein
MLAMLIGLSPLAGFVAMWWLLGVRIVDETLLPAGQVVAAILFAAFPGVAAAARLRFRSGELTLWLLGLTPALLAGLLFVPDAVSLTQSGRMDIGAAMLQRGLPVALVGAACVAGIAAAEWVMAPGSRTRLVIGVLVGAFFAGLANVAFWAPIFFETATM